MVPVVPGGGRYCTGKCNSPPGCPGGEFYRYVGGCSGWACRVVTDEFSQTQLADDASVVVEDGAVVVMSEIPLVGPSEFKQAVVTVGFVPQFSFEGGRANGHLGGGIVVDHRIARWCQPRWPGVGHHHIGGLCAGFV